MTLLYAALLDNRFTDAVAIGRRLQSVPDVPEPMKPVIDANLAVALTMGGSPALREEADRLSVNAVAHLGWQGPVIAVRALVPAARGADREARCEALEAAVRCERADDRAMAHALLAPLDERPGDLVGARRRFRVAHGLCPTEPLLRADVRRRVLGVGEPSAPAAT